MYRSILAPLDGSHMSEQSLPTAIDLCRRSTARLHLVQVRAPAGPAATRPHLKLRSRLAARPPSTWSDRPVCRSTYAASHPADPSSDAFQLRLPLANGTANTEAALPEAAPGRARPATSRAPENERVSDQLDRGADLPEAQHASPVRVRAYPPVEVLLDVDREYRRSAAAGRLRTIAPTRFNPPR
jgi:nucleotide-binding universal stress UspA family protein